MPAPHKQKPPLRPNFARVEVEPMQKSPPKTFPSKGFFWRAHSLGTKLTLIILAMAATLSVATIVFGYNQYTRSATELIVTNARNLTRSASSLINVDRIPAYIATTRKDSTYLTQQTTLRAMARDSEVADIFVLVPEEDGLVFVFDTDSGASHLDLGEMEGWYDGYLPYKDEMLVFESVPPLFTHSQYGYMLTLLQPLVTSRGDAVAYVGVDIDMAGLQEDSAGFLTTLVIITMVIAAAFTLLFVVVIRRTVVQPLNRMASAADDFLSGGGPAAGDAEIVSSLSRLNVQTRDELESLADSLKSMEKKIKEYIENLDVANQRAETDPLTGSFNRESFEHQVKVFLRSNGEEEKLHAFLMIDIDFFKQVNDTFGHAYGDEVLKGTAEALNCCFRSTDIVSRLGGDEFAVFCKSIGTQEKIAEKAGQLCEAVREIRIKEMGDVQFVSCSVGIALYPADASTYDGLYRRADMAMYQAKEAGRNRFAFYDASLADG